jgi:hypothetical protein
MNCFDCHTTFTIFQDTLSEREKLQKNLLAEDNRVVYHAGMGKLSTTLHFGFVSMGKQLVLRHEQFAGLGTQSMFLPSTFNELGKQFKTLLPSTNC